MFSKTATSLALLAAASNVLAAPVTPNPSSLLTRDATITNGSDQCYWTSTFAGGVVSWAIILTRWMNNSETQESNDLRASLDRNAACRAFSMYQKKAFGADEVVFVFNTAISCTAYQMTKVLEKTNGGAHGSIPCTMYAPGDGSPDPSDAIQEVPVEGEPVPDEGFEKRATTGGSVPSVDWEDLAKKLGLPAGTAKEVIVKHLEGPSKLDATW